MTDDERKIIMNLADTIIGEVKRMRVTNDLNELDTMTEHAKHNIFRLSHLIYITKFKLSNEYIYCDTDSIKTTKKEDKNKCGV